MMKRLFVKYFTGIRTLTAVTIGVLAVIVVVLFISSEPGESLTAFFLGPFRSSRTIANIFETASPIIFCGLAIAVSFQARQFYIGAEGALYLAAAVGTGIAVLTAMPWFFIFRSFCSVPRVSAGFGELFQGGSRCVTMRAKLSVRSCSTLRPTLADSSSSITSFATPRQDTWCLIHFPRAHS